jgi:Dolichyl-phosphate-mannose-protein mannosyltransferase
VTRTLALRPVLLVVAAKSALNLAFAGRYGWQRDELYYAVAGRHLQGGYVEFPPVTALLSALARVLFGWSLVGFRAFAILSGAATMVVAALVARELGGSARAQTLAAIAVGFTPLLIATNGLFQPVSFDQLATVVVLWLALRLALGRGSWPLLGLAAGVGLETKYTLAVVLVVLVAGFLVWRRDVLWSSGFVLAAGIAALLLVPNLVWEVGHGWTSVHWFLDPPASATDESRPEYVVNLLLLTHLVAVPVAAAGILTLVRDRALRPLGAAVVGTVVAYLVLGGKSYYAEPAVLFALAVGAVPFDRWATRRRLQLVGGAFVIFLVALLPLGLPVLPLRTADRLGVVAARSDYQDEVGWHGLARSAERDAEGADVVLASNYGEAGALELFGRKLPPVASGQVTFRYWRPAVTGRRALLVGFTRRDASFCRSYRLVGKIAMPVDNEERNKPIARCTLDASLARVWPQILGLYRPGSPLAAGLLLNRFPIFPTVSAGT